MKDDEEVAKTIADIAKRMEMLLSDTSIPKNVRTAINEAKSHLDSKQDDYVVKVSSAIYNLDSISNDINLPRRHAPPYGEY